MYAAALGLVEAQWTHLTDIVKIEGRRGHWHLLPGIRLEARQLDAVIRAASGSRCRVFDLVEVA